MDSKEFVICPECKEKVKKTNFCTNCGYRFPLDLIKPESEENGKEAVRRIDSDFIDNAVYNSDSVIIDGYDVMDAPSNLPLIYDPVIPTTLLAEYCSKTFATAEGDAYDEILLGVTEDGRYIIDIYSKKFSNNEIHMAYLTTENAYEKVKKYIEIRKLKELSKQRGFRMTGADYIVKFRDDDGKYIRVDSGNIVDNNFNVLNGLSGLLRSYIKDENRLDK